MTDRSERTWAARDFGPPVEPDFDGATYERKHDLGRLTGQIRRVRDLMIDGNWRTLEEISASTRDPAASVSAQLRNLRKARFGGHRVNKRARGERGAGLYEYQLLPAGMLL